MVWHVHTVMILLGDCCWSDRHRRARLSSPPSPSLGLGVDGLNWWQDCHYSLSELYMLFLFAFFLDPRQQIQAARSLATRGIRTV